MASLCECRVSVIVYVTTEWFTSWRFQKFATTTVETCASSPRTRSAQSSARRLCWSFLVTTGARDSSRLPDVSHLTWSPPPLPSPPPYHAQTPHCGRTVEGPIRSKNVVKIYLYFFPVILTEKPYIRRGNITSLVGNDRVCEDENWIVKYTEWSTKNRERIKLCAVFFWTTMWAILFTRKRST